jgi:hypothetical protein
MTERSNKNGKQGHDTWIYSHSKGGMSKSISRVVWMYDCNKQEFCKQNDGVEFPVSSLITAGRKNTVNTPSKTNGMKEFTDPYLTHIYCQSLQLLTDLPKML